MKSATKILWLCKLKYMNHDVIRDRFGRLFELPQSLSREARVTAFCLSYSLKKTAPVCEDLKPAWSRESIPRTVFVGWFFILVHRARAFGPQCVVASSDCLHIILGAVVSRLCGARFVADLYDDYSTFGMAKIPGMRWLYFRALASADGVSVVSRTLGKDIAARFPDKPVIVLESTIDGERFVPRDKVESRQMLALDSLRGKKLVGVCGGLDAAHGAEIVFQAFHRVAALDPDVVFVVAGKLYDECPLPDLENVKYLGMLPHEQMSHFFSALDVAIVALSNNRFGYYAFPQKAYEVVACHVPVAAADVGALSMLFSDLPGALYDPDSPDSLAATVMAQLQSPQWLEVEIPTWDRQATALCTFIDGQVVDRAVA